MKHKFWFFYFIVFLIFLNIITYMFFKYGNISDKIKQKISYSLSKVLNAKVEIGELSINDKQLNISKLKIKAKDNSFFLCSKQIYIEFNLFNLLKSRFKNFKGITYIKIFDPKIQINIKHKSKKKKKRKKFKIPDLQNYFKNLELYEGSLAVRYNADKVKFEQNLTDINIKIKNGKKNILKFSANGVNNDSIYAKLVFKKNVLKNIDVNIFDYYPKKLLVKNFPYMNFLLDLTIHKDENGIKIYGNLKNNKIKYKKWELISSNIDIKGNKENVSFLFKKNTTKLDKNPLTGVVKLFNFNDKPKINAKLNIQNIDVKRYSKYVVGEANADIVISNFLYKPIVKINANSKKLEIRTEKFFQVKAFATYKRGKFSFFLNDLIWEGNHLKGKGYITKKEGVVFSLQKKSLKLNKFGYLFNTDLSAFLKYKKKINLVLNLNNLKISNKNIKIDQLNLIGKIKDKNWKVVLSKRKNINLIANGNFKKRDLIAELKLKHLKLSEVFDNLVFPITSGKINFNLNNGKLYSNADIIFYDQNFGKFDGEIFYNFQLDKKNNFSMLKLNTKHARYNFEPFSIDFLASGEADSIRIQKFIINNQLQIEGFCKWKPKFDIAIKAVGNNVKLKDILKYFTDYETLANYSGNINFAINYHNWKRKNIEGIITANKLGIGIINNVDAYITFFGNKSFFTLDNLQLYQNSKKFFAAQGNMLFKPGLRAKFIGKIKNLNLAKFFKTKSMKGLLNSDILLSINGRDKLIDLEATTSKGKLFGVNMDSLMINLSQENKILSVKKVYMKAKEKFIFNAKGKIGYNIFNQNFYALNDTLNVSFKGDLLDILQNKIRMVEEGKSNSNFNIKLSTQENGLKIISADLNIQNGILKLKNQPAATDNININFQVRNDSLQIKKFKFRMGKGYFYLKNKIYHSKKDFIFANVDLGQLFIKTNKSGVLVYIPGYIPENSFITLKIRGREDDYLKIYGPFDDIKINGDIEASNGNIVYPPNTDNLLKILKNPINTKHKESEIIYPFSLDIMLHIGENVHYTTYPINLLMKKGGFLNLIYKDGVFSIPDAFFVSESGNLDIFGTEMKADYVSVRINKLVNGFKLNAEFFKDIPDGTRVTMIVFTENDKGKNKIKFKFLSDHPGDSTMDIISMLRYGKRMESIDPSQRNSLLKDEILQIAGIGIENAFITPLFYPFENFIKHFFRLDYFNIKTGIIQNVFNRYYRNFQENEFTAEQNKITKFGTDMFLNNLTLQFTKQIYRKTFLDYTVSFQKSSNLAIQSKLGIYHNFSLKIEIPYKFRLSLDYNILPFHQKNSFQIGIEKSIKFN